MTTISYYSHCKRRSYLPSRGSLKLMWCYTGDSCTATSLVADPVQRVLPGFSAITFQAAFIFQAAPTAVWIPERLNRHFKVLYEKGKQFFE